ncbi:MAG: glycoside hydrolase family 3 C-terminal domain-containing protein, partial [Ruminococcus sp.]|nr:glycoside hydrolase family 3 C-terminal domain-containing protein [Ruminococcus sp.]
MKKRDPLRARAEELTEQLTLEEKLGLLTTHHKSVERLGLGEFRIGTEIARGYVGRSDDKPSTVLPQPIGLAGTFDRELMHSLGDIAGDECRAYYNGGSASDLCIWGPTVDMERDPRWGRTEEAYGEDVCLAGEMTAAYTLGLAGDDPTYVKTIPTLKHFCANNNEHERGSCNAFLPPRLKYEYYYAAFRTAIEFGGARSVMAAYNEINRLPALCNPDLQTVLKDKWGMWFAVTDGGDFSQNVTYHGFFDRHSETLAEALKAGCDTMTDSDILTENAAREALAAGLLTEADIDRTVANVLFARLKLGQLADDCPYDKIGADVVDSPAHRALNLRAAREQIVLLENGGLLPVAEKPRKIAVVGALCDENLMDWYTGIFRDAVSPAEGIRREFSGSEVVQDSLWDIVAIQADNGRYLSVHEDGTIWADAEEIGENELFEMQIWDEHLEDFGRRRDCQWTNFFSVKHQKFMQYRDGLRLNNRTIYDWFTLESFEYVSDGATGYEYLRDLMAGGRMTANSSGRVTFDPCMNGQNMHICVVDRAAERAARLRTECDLIVYCTGNHPVQVAKECYDRKTLSLTIQRECRDILAEAGDRLVTVLISSYPYAITGAKNLIYTTHAGAHLGTAIAETISGRNVPAGRLAMTWYRSELDLPDIMEYDIERGCTTYMYFKGEPLYPFGYGLSYACFEYVDMELTGGKFPEAVVHVRNISATDGDEVVQLYFTLPDSKLRRPAKKLCAFARVHIRAGETAEVLLKVPRYILEVYDTHSGEMLVESGVYRFMAGGSSAELPLAGEVAVDGAEIPLRGSAFAADSFDGYDFIETAWSKRLHRHYVRTKGWGGTLTYSGCEFADKTRLVLSAAAFTGSGTVSLHIADKQAEVELS